MKGIINKLFVISVCALIVGVCFGGKQNFVGGKTCPKGCRQAIQDFTMWDNNLNRACPNLNSPCQNHKKDPKCKVYYQFSESSQCKKIKQDLQKQLPSICQGCLQ